MRRSPSHDFYPAHSAADTVLGSDVRRPQLAGAFDVGASAKLFAETSHGDHADAVAVFLAEEGCRSFLQGFLERLLHPLDGEIGQDLAIDQVFDRLNLLWV